MKGAFYTGGYRNRFKEFGYDEKAIDQKLEDAFQSVFHGPEEEKFYHEIGDDFFYWLE